MDSFAVGARGDGEVSLCDARPRPHDSVVDNTARFLKRLQHLIFVEAEQRSTRAALAVKSVPALRLSKCFLNERENNAPRCQCHVMMPADPTAQFIMVHSEMIFFFFEDRFDRPPHPAEANKDLRCGCRRSISRAHVLRGNELKFFCRKVLRHCVTSILRTATSSPASTRRR